jgi:hypothetical protein
MAMIFKITNVDMSGFCGREFHPSPSDTGLRVVPVKMETEIMDGKFNPNMDPTDAEIAAECLKALRGDADDMLCYVVWTCFTEDGRKLELMDFEVELETTNA